MSPLRGSSYDDVVVTEISPLRGCTIKLPYEARLIEHLFVGLNNVTPSGFQL